MSGPDRTKPVLPKRNRKYILKKKFRQNFAQRTGQHSEKIDSDSK